MIRAIQLVRIASYLCGAAGVILVLWAKMGSEPYGPKGQAGMVLIIASTLLILLTYVLRMVANAQKKQRLRD